MSDIAIRVENLGKRYKIGRLQKRNDTLRDALAERLSQIANRKSRVAHRESPIANRQVSSANGDKQPVTDDMPSAISHPPSANLTQSSVLSPRSSEDILWALKDVSFEVKRGEVVGIIGRNGAGKSTLLKILSRITEPTTGTVDLYGRVGSLLEVGTGFHPELTGRENIFLNGAILGMRKAEIEKRFDEIVAFAEVEKFIDTPVKRYSSGMYVRLAFAVAAHLEPEILVVDEVLAVGDAAFQKKCLGKMGDVAREGRTVLFVSHNMAAISNLCPSSMLLNQGRMVCLNKTGDVIEQYQLTIKAVNSPEDVKRLRPSWARPMITSVRILSDDGEPRDSFPLGSDIIVEMSFDAQSEALSNPVMGVVINHLTRGTAGGVNTRMSGFWPSNGPYHSAVMRCKLRRIPLLQGSYTVDVWLGNGMTDVDMLKDCASFSIEATDFYGTGQTPFAHMGLVALEPLWEISNQRG